MTEAFEEVIKFDDNVPVDKSCDELVILLKTVCVFEEYCVDDSAIVVDDSSCEGFTNELNACIVEWKTSEELARVAETNEEIISKGLLVCTVTDNVSSWRAWKYDELLNLIVESLFIGDDAGCDGDGEFISNGDNGNDDDLMSDFLKVIEENDDMLLSSSELWRLLVVDCCKIVVDIEDDNVDFGFMKLLIPPCE